MNNQHGKDDIRKELKIMITDTQNAIVDLQKKKDKINEELQDAESALSALRQVYEIQAKRFGEIEEPLSAKESTSYRFAGMRLIDALAILKKENPKIDKRQAVRLLQEEGYNFRGKRPLTAVHFAWIVLGRKNRKE